MRKEMKLVFKFKKEKSEKELRDIIDFFEDVPKYEGLYHQEHIGHQFYFSKAYPDYDYDLYISKIDKDKGTILIVDEH
ncbi:MAG: hypothetical protein ACOCQR_02235 [bacterium]